MNNKFIYLLGFMLISVYGIAQKSISGSVIDKKTGQSIAFVSIISNSNETLAITDEKGNFTIETPSDQAIICTRIGYENLSYQITNESTLTLNMTAKPIIIEEIFVTDHNTSQSNISVNGTQKISQPRNIADLFDNANGFSMAKRSNYSLDPVFRSFKYEQLNVQYDGGVKAMHACPNRMDPVTTHVMPEEIEKIEVIRGPFSVRFGSNFGGLVNLKTHSPFRNQGMGFHGSVRTGYELNGNSFLGMVSLGLVKEKYDLMINGGIRDYGNYTDGNGTEVPSSFKSYDYSAKLGFKPQQNHLAQLTWRQSFARDVLHAGLPMDSPEDNSSIVSFDYKIQNISKKLYSVSFKGFYADVDHLMSNELRKNFKIVEAQTPVNAKTYGGKIELSLHPTKSLSLFTGVDLSNIHRTGERERLVKIAVKPDTMIVLGQAKNFVDSVWQNCTINDVGAFIESHYYLNDRLSINTGLRVDFVNAKIEEPAKEFRSAYKDFQDLNETNISGFASMQYKIRKGTSLELAIGRGVRTASETERYINHLSVGSDPYELFGNPLLKPEENHQIELSAKHTARNWEAGANIYYSLLNNYISAAVDSTVKRKFLPWKNPTVARRFINLDQATQKGFEAYTGFRVYKGFSIKAAVNYTAAHNVDTDEPLPLIPPMQSLLSLHYEQDLFWVDLQNKFVSKQDRIANSYGETETPSYMNIDLKAGVNLMKNMHLGISVLNLLDEKYYDHLSWKYNNQSDTNLTGRFYEQGRNFTAYFKYTF